MATRKKRTVVKPPPPVIAPAEELISYFVRIAEANWMLREMVGFVSGQVQLIKSPAEPGLANLWLDLSIEGIPELAGLYHGDDLRVPFDLGSANMWQADMALDQIKDFYQNWSKKQLARASALAKLTPEERKALGV
jgi:hypothetical protein